jgi:hypothetical protein
MDNFNQLAAQPLEIKVVRELVAALTEREIDVETLYGGYLLMLMAFDGLKGLSNGILYTQHKDYGGTPGAAVVPDRYYIPAFHEFRSLSQTDLILHRHPELICNCPICVGVMGKDPDRFIHFDDEPELLRKHFITVRRKEADDLRTAKLPNILTRLRATHTSYHKTVSALPNPDAFISSGPMKGLEYLLNWANGLS